MKKMVPVELLDLYFPGDADSKGVAPQGESLDCLSKPMRAQALYEAGERAAMGFFDSGRPNEARALLAQLDDPERMSAVVRRHAEEFFIRRNEGPLTPLHDAILAGDATLAAKLLRSGHPESKALPSLHAAAIVGAPETIDALVGAGADVQAKTPAGATAVFAAVAANHVEAAKALLLHGADPRIADQTGATPLMLAIANFSPDCVELLLPLSDPRARDHKGRSACECAPPFHADPDDPGFEHAMRYSRLLLSLQEASQFDAEAGKAAPQARRAL